jgi:hypothetical protein
MLPERLDELHPEEHQRIYKTLRLKTSIYADGSTKLSGVLVSKEDFYTVDITSRRGARVVRSEPYRSSI